MTKIAHTARWATGALAGLGVRDLVGALVVVLIGVVALCWVLCDEDRSRRLAEIIGAWRGARSRATGQSTRKLLGTGAGQQRPGPGRCWAWRSRRDPVIPAVITLNMAVAPQDFAGRGLTTA